MTVKILFYSLYMHCFEKGLNLVYIGNQMSKSGLSSSIVWWFLMFVLLDSNIRHNNTKQYPTNSQPIIQDMKLFPKMSSELTFDETKDAI